MKDKKSNLVTKGTKEYRNTFIDKDLCKAVSKNTYLIKDALAQESKLNLSIGKHLCELKSQFELIAKNRHKQPGTAAKAFNEYIQVQFDIRASRAGEYIRLAKVFNGLKLNLEASKLIELSRLNQSVLKKFLEKYSSSQLSAWPYRKVRDLVRESNENKRTIKASSKKKPEPKATNPEPSYNEQLRKLTNDELSTGDLFKLAVETVVSSVGSGPIPLDVVEQIDILVNWKSSKQLKVVG